MRISPRNAKGGVSCVSVVTLAAPGPQGHPAPAVNPSAPWLRRLDVEKSHQVPCASRLLQTHLRRFWEVQKSRVRWGQSLPWAHHTGGQISGRLCAVLCNHRSQQPALPGKQRAAGEASRSPSSSSAAPRPALGRHPRSEAAEGSCVTSATNLLQLTRHRGDLSPGTSGLSLL